MDKGSCLANASADGDSAGVHIITFVPDIDVIIPEDEEGTGAIPQCDIVAAGAVHERLKTHGSVRWARCIPVEGVSTIGHVPGADVVAKESLRANGRVEGAPGVAKERFITDGRVLKGKCIVGK